MIIGKKTILQSRAWWAVGGFAGIFSVVVLAWCLMPDSPPHWSDIQGAAAQRRWAEAEAGLARWLERSPDDGAAWLMLGGIRDIQGRADEALAAYRKVRRPEPARVQALTLAGEIHLRGHEAAAAERAFRDASLSDSKAVGPRRRLAFLLSLERRTDEARAMLWEIYQITGDPRDLATLVGLGAVDPSADPIGLDTELEPFLKKTPDDPWLLRSRGISLLLRERPSEAEPYLATAASGLADDPAGRQAGLGRMPDRAWQGSGYR
jgi:enediyne biosynthesis protein E4